MIYLDHASHAPVRPDVARAVADALTTYIGDPGRVHRPALETRAAIEVAREQLGACVGALPREVVFTGSGTEAVNMAIWGAATSGTVVRSAVEHAAVRDALDRAPVAQIAVGVDALGRVDTDAFLAACPSDTTLVCIQLANHEVATLQPAAAIIAAARDRGIRTFVDARAAFGHIALDFAGLGADLCAITAHTAGGPPGIGALLIRKGLRIDPLIVGGAQERARRAGTENTPAIVGFGVLAELLTPARIAEEAARNRAQTEALAAATAAVTDVTRFGDPVERLPHIVCVGVGGVEAEPVLLGLDQRGIAAHSGSSCSSELIEPSPVLEAMGADANHSLRLSVGWNTTDDDITGFATAFPDVVANLRALHA